MGTSLKSRHVEYFTSIAQYTRMSQSEPSLISTRETGLTNPYRCFIIFCETLCWEIRIIGTLTAKSQGKLIGENS